MDLTPGDLLPFCFYSNLNKVHLICTWELQHDKKTKQKKTRTDVITETARRWLLDWHGFRF